MVHVILTKIQLMFPTELLHRQPCQVTTLPTEKQTRQRAPFCHIIKTTVNNISQASQYGALCAVVSLVGLELAIKIPYQ